MVRIIGRSRGSLAPGSPGTPEKKRDVASKVSVFLGRLFKDPGNDVPSEVDFTLESFLKYRDSWLLWRAMGHETEGGAWVAPVDFLQARAMPREELDVYQGLDHFLNQMKKKKASKKKAKGK